MVVFFDIETTGLVASSKFVCAVILTDGGVLSFATADEVIEWILTSDETIVSWNGLAFDFKFLFDRCQCEQTKARLAFAAVNRHVDIMFDFMVSNGYPASMQSFATPLGHSKSWSGAEAATSEDYDAIVAYCKDDVAVLKQIYTAGLAQGWLARMTKANKKVVWVLHYDQQHGTPYVRNCIDCLNTLGRTPPNQSWMTDPIRIPDTVAWATDSVRQCLK